jgi:AcrR family transcriptional regulator
MSRCSVCDHERREAIERHLAEGISLRVVAKATGISKGALYRHQKNHNVRELSDAVADRIASGAADGDQGLGDLISSLQLAFEVALQKGDLSRVATLSRELRAAYLASSAGRTTGQALVARIVHELQARSGRASLSDRGHP